MVEKINPSVTPQTNSISSFFTATYVPPGCRAPGGAEACAERLSPCAPHGRRMGVCMNWLYADGGPRVYRRAFTRVPLQRKACVGGCWALSPRVSAWRWGQPRGAYFTALAEARSRRRSSKRGRLTTFLIAVILNESQIASHRRSGSLHIRALLLVRCGVGSPATTTLLSSACPSRPLPSPPGRH